MQPKVMLQLGEGNMKFLLNNNFCLKSIHVLSNTKSWPLFMHCSVLIMLGINLLNLSNCNLIITAVVFTTD